MTTQQMNDLMRTTGAFLTAAGFSVSYFEDVQERHLSDLVFTKGDIVYMACGPCATGTHDNQGIDLGMFTANTNTNLHLEKTPAGLFRSVSNIDKMIGGYFFYTEALSETSLTSFLEKCDAIRDEMADYIEVVLTDAQVKCYLPVWAAARHICPADK